MINTRLCWLLEHRKLINPCQSGFRQYYSTLDQLINLEANICDAFINRQHLTAVCMDIEKAYDMVSRTRILNSLQKKYINGNIFHFIKNFLKLRKIKVRTNNILSEYETLDNGVPQGSIISVTLFTIAINDIISVIDPPIVASLYADDLTIYYKGKNPTNTQYILQECINKLQIWVNSNGFKVSKTKTEVITFNRTQENIKINLTLENIPLK